MNKNTINEEISSYVINKLAKRKNYKHVDGCDDLISSGIVDSLGVMQLISFLEEKFSICVKDEDVVPDNFQTVDSITLYVSSKV